MPINRTILGINRTEISRLRGGAISPLIASGTKLKPGLITPLMPPSTLVSNETLNDFYNDGFGWICRHCERELESGLVEPERSRLMFEGEAESKTPILSNRALAKWLDAAQTTLIC